MRTSISVAMSLVSLAALGCSGGNSTQNDAGPDGGQMTTTSLVGVLASETNGQAAAQAYKDHLPTAAETNQIGAFLAYTVNAQNTGGLEQGFLASSLATEIQTIALEYPDFFVSTDAGLAVNPHLRPRYVNSPQDFSCDGGCEPGAAAFNSAFAAAVPTNLSSQYPAVASLVANFGSAAQTLESGGTSPGAAFDQAIASANVVNINAFLLSFANAELQPGDLMAAETSLGLSSADAQNLINAVSSVYASLVLVAADVAITQAAELSQECVSYQAQMCGGTTSATTSTGVTTSSSSGAGGATGNGSATGAKGSSTSSGATTASGGVASGTGTGATTTGATSGAATTSGASTSGSATPTPGTLFSTGTVDYRVPSSPDYAMVVTHDSSANQLAVWNQFVNDGGCAEPFASFHSVATQTWSAPAAVPVPAITYNTTYNTCAFDELSGALSDNGDAIVAWPAYQFINAANYITVYADHYDHFSKTWSGPSVIGSTSLLQPTNAFQTGNGETASALNASGNGWVVFQGPPYWCDDNRMYGVAYVFDGGWGQPAIIDPDATAVPFSQPEPSDCTCSVGTTVKLVQQLGVVALTDDSFVTAWGEEDQDCASSAYTSFYGGARAVAGTWGTPFFLQTPGDYTAPTLLQLSAGGANVAAAWLSFVDGGPTSEVAPASAAVTGLGAADSNWEGTLNLPDQNNSSALYAAVNLGASGAGMVAWSGIPTGSANGVAHQFVAPISPSLALGAEVDLSATCGFDGGLNPQAAYTALAVDAAGEAAVTWEVSPIQTFPFSMGATYSPASGWGGCGYVGAQATGNSGPLYPIPYAMGNSNFGSFYVLQASALSAELYNAPGQP